MLKPAPEVSGQLSCRGRAGSAAGGTRLLTAGQLALHLLVTAKLTDLVQGAQGRLLHLDLQLPQAGRSGSKVAHPQSTAGPLPAPEQ